MTTGLLTAAALLGTCAIVWIVRAARRDGDTARYLLTLACSCLPADRAAWGQAMRTELTYIEGRAARWRFAFGGIRAATTARTVGRLRTQPGLAFVLAGLLIGAGLTVTALVTYPSLRTSPKIRPFLIVTIIVFAIYLALAIAGASDTHPAARPARRYGPLTGAILAPPWFVFAGAWWNLHGTPLILVVLIPAIAAAAAARTTGSAHAGISTVLWAGLVAGVAVFIAFTIDGFATANGPYDASQRSEYAHSGTPSPTAYWLGEDLAAALLLLMIIPCLTIASGTVGAVIANRRIARQPHRPHP